MIKRAIDIVGAVVLLTASAPLMLVIAAMIRVTMGGPVLFRQTRTGKGGALFTLVKFRSMRPVPEDTQDGRADAERLTPFGRLLRRTSLDELPTLWNVLKGEMSLVGPRPLLPRYLPLYSTRQARRHEVKPGVTGWAQVNGRNAIDWDRKFELDVWYVEQRSVLLDLRILGLTVAKVLRREGISQEGRATTEFFQGNDPAEGGEA